MSETTPAAPSPSYRPGDCCSSADCMYLGSPTMGQCWGQVTVIDEMEGEVLDASWLDEALSPFARRDCAAWFAQMVAACSAFVPELRAAKLSGVLEGPRMVLAGSDMTDERPSFVTQHEPGYLTVFAGKIDHCIEASDDVVRMVGAC